MSDPSPQPNQPPIALLALLLLGTLLYAATIGMVADLDASDSAGRALGEAFGALYGSVLWIVLAAMIIIAGVTGKMPVWAGIAAAILVPASAVASAIAVEFIRYRSGWQILVPGLIPPLIAAYAFWARFPRLHRVLPPTVTSIVIWGAVLLLTAAPLPDWIAAPH